MESIGTIKHRVLVGLLASVLICSWAAAAIAQQDPFAWARDYTQKALAGGRAGEAAKELEGWAAEFEKSRDAEKASIYLTQASFAAQASGQLQHGRDLAQRAYEIAERAKDPVQQARAVTALVQALNGLRQYGQVRPWLDRGFAATPRIGHAVTREALEAGLFLSLGNLQLRDGQVKQAIESFTHSVRLRDSIVSFMGRGGGASALPAVQTNLVLSLSALANAYTRANRAEEALAANERGLEIVEKFGLQSFSAIQTTLHLQIGRLHLRRRAFDRAEHHLRAAVVGAAKLRQPVLHGNASQMMGNLLLQTSRPTEAIAHLRAAIESVEQTRSRLSSEELRSAFFEDKEELYRLMILAQLRSNNFAEAFNYNERGRSRAFLDVLGSSAQVASDQVLAEESALRQRVDALTERLTNAELSRRERIGMELDLAVKNHREFLAKIRAQNKEQASLMNVEPLTLAQVQQLLDSGTTMIEYFVGPDAVHTWIVEKGRVEFVSLDLKRQDLVARVHFLRDLIGQPDKVDGFRRESAELFKLLMAPALQHVRGQELIVVPHDVLHYLPFQALVSAQGKYLVEEYPISYLSSASLMQFTREKRRASRQSTMAMGNPNLGDDAYNLRFAEREAKEIALVFPQSSIYLRDEATKARAIATGPQNDIVHFAVHAEFNQDEPMKSALLLARNGQDDGRLKVSEIFALKLNADLVVLSACETGLGKINSGDEIVGMTRAFIYAGTPSVVTTLWKVNDRASFELMKEFYLQLKTQKKSAALRHAQLKIIKEFPQPFYWAAYQLTGES